MDTLKKYNIAFVGLSLGKHCYNYDLDEYFFECFEKTEVEYANVKLELVLEKSNSMLVLDFNIKGKVKLICDRCCDYYWQDIKSSDRLYFKFGDTPYEQSEKIIVIAHNETHINVSQYAYEFVHLSLPVRRLHPGGKQKADNCDPVVLKKLNELLVETDEQGFPKASAKDHWEALRNLKNN